MCRCLKIFDYVLLETKTTAFLLDNARDLDVVIQRHQNFCFLTRYGEFTYPHVVIQGIITNPIHIIHDGSDCFVSSTLACFFVPQITTLCVDPFARCESGTHPFFFFPSFNFVHHCHSVGEQRGRTRMLVVHVYLCRTTDAESVSPRRSARTASRRIPSCFWPFHSARGSATFTPS